MQESWNSEKSKDLYGISHWGKSYFNISKEGDLQVHPSGKPAQKINVHTLTEDLVERGLRLPILIRFSDILHSRIQLISNCFEKAIKEYSYRGDYKGVYPIKVNQERHLVQDIVKYGEKFHLGLECGSKPELLIALAFLKSEEAFIICNGFKDSEYIETALLSQLIGRNTVIVVDRMAEVQLIINASKKLKIKPRIGFRCKLNSQGQGKWIESSGAKSKFGLTPSEMVSSIALLKKAGLLKSIELLHFHIGSQIPSIQSIKSSVKEAAHFYTELKKLAPALSLIDVGGGLGVDYDGSGASDSSTNYSEQEYANDVVSIIQSICDERKVEHPHIISESGRTLVAHSTMLIFNILGANEILKSNIDFKVTDKDSRLVQEIFEIYENVGKHNVNESYNDLVEKKRDTLQLFKYGALDLKQRAKAEDLYWASATKIQKFAQQNKEDAGDIYYSLEAELADTYFCNFSVFQSLPDSWALKQLFPVMPIHRLETKPDKRAVLVDLTCDSDGKIDSFINISEGKPQKYLEVHKLLKSQPYYLGVFLTGAYQEILGDLHNLFGDIDAVHVSINKKGYMIDHVVEGDAVTDVLSYVSYDKTILIEKIRKSCEHYIQEESLTRSEARLLMKHYEQGLSGYTYFEE
ncbi:MAG: biosynthetic arginine decarboxylase [Bdellovibrionaceae bacterium]|jgi:arginine decarboxylase|nr:biosynthetic arginine decarboxylase [Pseudobdellovibrionaceae bacterium]